jgi:hypothetical protein
MTNSGDNDAIFHGAYIESPYKKYYNATHASYPAPEFGMGKTVGEE